MERYIRRLNCRNTPILKKSFSLNHKQLRNTQLKPLTLSTAITFPDFFGSLTLFYLFLAVEIHFLKWDILRPWCHKRFTQCPLCNSCKTQTKLLLTPHAVPPLTKWNPRTTFGFWPITLEGDGDWKQYYESRSVIKSLLLGQRSGWGEGALCETTEDLFYFWKHNVYKRRRKNTAKAKNFLTSSDLTFACFHDERFTCRRETEMS